MHPSSPIKRERRRGYAVTVFTSHGRVTADSAAKVTHAIRQVLANLDQAD